jgi:hypothetical protein
LRSNEGRISAHSDAGSHMVWPSKHGLDAECMRM